MRARAEESFRSLFATGSGTAPARQLLGTAVALVAFTASCLGVGRLLDGVDGFWREEAGAARIKARHVEERLDDYDVVFVGSSRVYRQLDPRVFDRVAREGGHEVRSYNLGLPGMRWYEALHVVRDLIERRPARLDTIVVEGLDPDPRLEEHNRTSRREIGWHTPGLTTLAVRRSLGREGPLPERFEEAAAHLGQFGARWTNVGTAPDLLRALQGKVRVPEDKEHHGYVPLELDPAASVLERRRQFLEDYAADRELLERRKDDLRAQGESAPDPLLFDVLAELESAARDAGVRLSWLVLPPAEQLRPELSAAREAGRIEELFDYADPDRYPQFYDSFQERWDLNHLTREAATELTTLFAREFFAGRERGR